MNCKENEKDDLVDASKPYPKCIAKTLPSFFNGEVVGKKKKKHTHTIVKQPILFSEPKKMCIYPIRNSKVIQL